MAEIATYTCSNLRCMFTVRLSRDFPVWRTDTPKELRTLSVHPSAREYITRYRSESFCGRCRNVVEYTEAHTCARCDTQVHTEHFSKPCPQCHKGTLAMPQLSVY